MYLCPLKMKKQSFNIIFRLWTCLTLWWTVSTTVQAQVQGFVTDSLTRKPVSFVQVYYEGSSVGTQTDERGYYYLPAPSSSNTTTLIFSSIEYNPKKISVKADTPQHINITLSEHVRLLSEVTVKPRKERYRRKNNPAVELMRRVIANKWKSDIQRHPWCSYYSYQKITTSLDDVTPSKLESTIFKQVPSLINHVEIDTVTHRLILPLVVNETVSRHLWREFPKAEKTIVMGEQSNGINDLLSVGKGLNTIMENYMGAINIHDEDIYLLGKRFISPIATTGAISFYQYYIMDTLKVQGDSCIHLTFVPQNSQDFGFSGHLYVTKDSTCQVKLCQMTFPQKTGINFVDEITIRQEFEPLPNGSWALKTDDFRVNLSLIDQLQSAQIQRTTRYSDYSFAPLEASLFKGNSVKEVYPDATIQTEEFWQSHRPIQLTAKERNMKSLVEDVKQMPGFRYIIFAVRALVENFIETGRDGQPSRFDIGPVNTMVSSNYIDGIRLRFSGKTTAAFNPHLFFKGYIAYGIKDHRPKYKAEVEYTFEKKKRLPFEFPRRSIAFSHQYDVMSPADKYLVTDKDNMFLSLKANTVDQLSFIRRNALTFVYETDNMFSVHAELRHTNDQPVGRLSYIRNDGTNVNMVKRLTTSEASLTLRYAPGETFIHSKQGRMAVNRNASVFTLSHTVGLDDILGSDYHYHMTELSFYKRFWLSSWGRVNTMLKGGAVWNRVPFPLLMFPAANQSFIIQNNHFHMINNMEFLNDRYASLDIVAELNGVLLNRIPLLKHLKWREVFGVSLLYGSLSDKNNPYATPGDNRIFLFPTRNGQATSFVMDSHTPYMEYHAGLYNVFKILRIEYYRRLTYLHLPEASKHGVRMALQFSF